MELLRNASARRQPELYPRSGVLLHAMIGERLGIAVVEGMVTRLVPVVCEIRWSVVGLCLIEAGTG